MLENRLLVQSHRAHAVPLRPEMQPGEIAGLSQAFPVNPNRRFPFQETHRVRHTEFRQNAQTRVDVIRHRVSFNPLHTRPNAQLAQNPTHLPPQRSVEHTPTALRHKHHMILAAPFHMGLALPISHEAPLPVSLIGRRASTTPKYMLERRSLAESTARGSGLPNGS